MLKTAEIRKGRRTSYEQVLRLDRSALEEGNNHFDSKKEKTTCVLMKTRVGENWDVTPGEKCGKKRTGGPGFQGPSNKGEKKKEERKRSEEFRRARASSRRSMRTTRR